jgi:hypothetical protein
LIVSTQQLDAPAEDAALTVDLLCGELGATPNVATIGSLIPTQGGFQSDQQGLRARPSLPLGEAAIKTICDPCKEKTIAKEKGSSMEIQACFQNVKDSPSIGQVNESVGLSF